MPYTAPTVAALLEQQASYFEEVLTAYAARKGLAVEPAAIARAVRSPYGMVAAMARNNAMLLAGVHQHITWATQQRFVDTAVERYVAGQHAATWGIVQRPATRAIGRATLTGTPGTAVPADIELRVPGAGLLRVTTPAVIGAGGTVLVDLEAIEPGPSANAPAGTVLPLIVALPGLTDQAAVADAAGLAGGAAAETVEELAARILERIQAPPHGGAPFDYPVWVRNGFAVSHVEVLQAIARGTVRVAVAMGTRAAPRAPIPAELDAIAAHVGRYNLTEGVRPVTADVFIHGVTLRPIDHRVEITPDRADVRTAVTAAIGAFYASDAAIGGTIHTSRLSEAISAAAGEYAHKLWTPAASVVAGELELPIPGTLTWGAP